MNNEGKPKLNPRNEPETRDQKIGRLDSLIHQIDIAIVTLGEPGQQGFSQIELETLTQRKDAYIAERTLAAGESPSSRTPNKRNGEE